MDRRLPCGGGRHALLDKVERPTKRRPGSVALVTGKYIDRVGHSSVISLSLLPAPMFIVDTVQMYMQSRNFMVRSYQRMLEADKDGQAYLTGTECRRKLAGDACSTLR